MNIVVLAGGLSTERDVSLNTGTMVSKALRSKGHNVIMLDVFMGYHEEEEDITDIFNHTEEASADVAQIPGEALLPSAARTCIQSLSDATNFAAFPPS